MAKKLMNLRLDENLIAECKATAKDAGLTLVDWATAVFDLAVHFTTPSAAFEAQARADIEEAKTKAPPVSADRLERAARIAAKAPVAPPILEKDGVPCRHPKEDWQSLSWGTVCGHCKARVR